MRATAAPDLSSYSYSGTGYVTSDANMNVAQWFDYAPYGSVIATTNTGQTTAGRQFEGLFTDSTNLVYSNARYLNPAQGQFTTEDPVFVGIGADKRTALVLQDPQQLNSYSYARNNPIVLKDPNGDFLPLLIAAVEIGVEAYGAYQFGHGLGDVLNTQYLFRDDYSNSDRNDALFNFGVNSVLFSASRIAKPLTLLERTTLAVGPDVAGFAGNFALPSTNGQTQGIQNYNPVQQFTNNYPGISPSMYQMISPQINSPSIQDRYKAAQTYNAVTNTPTGSGGGGGGSAPSPSSLWVTPSGAVVTFGGQLVAPPPTTH
jgi:RHS repeat-associated protein